MASCFKSIDGIGPTMNLDSGSATEPILASASCPDTGVYFEDSPCAVSVSTNGVKRMRVSNDTTEIITEAGDYSDASNFLFNFPVMSDLTDTSGAGYTLSKIGTPTPHPEAVIFGSYTVAGSLENDGTNTNAYVGTIVDGSVWNNTTLSLSIWFKLDVTGANQTFMNVSDGTTSNWAAVSFNSGGALQYTNQSGATGIRYAQITFTNTTSWHHLAVVDGPTVGDFKMYLDGVDTALSVNNLLSVGYATPTTDYNEICFLRQCLGLAVDGLDGYVAKAIASSTQWTQTDIDEFYTSNFQDRTVIIGSGEVHSEQLYHEMPTFIVAFDSEDIPTAVDTIHTEYNTPTYNNGYGQFNASTGELYIAQEGLYMFGFMYSFDSNASGVRIVRLLLNGLPVLSSDNFSNSSSYNTTLTCAGTRKFVQGDILSIEVYQNTGGIIGGGKAGVLNPGNFYCYMVNPNLAIVL